MNSKRVQLIPLQRHSCVWLSSTFAPSAIRLVNDDYRAAIAAHAGRGHPFVARRPQPCDGDTRGCVPLGLRLPGTSAVRSLSFCAEPDAIAKVEDAMPLAEALECEGLPPAWRPALQQLLQALQAIGVTPLVYGSLAWQSATGVAYLAEGSDVDLLLRPASAQQARACLDIVNMAARSEAQSTAIRLDGEMEFPDGRAISWKELATNATHMLVKTGTGITLDTTESIWNQTSWQ